MAARTPKTNRKPATAEEIKKDIEDHPDRGKLNGQPVVRFEPDEVRVRIPKQLHRRFILFCGAMGMTKTDGIEYAIARLVNDPGTSAVIQDFLDYQAELHSTSKVEVVNAVFGAFKDIARRKRAQLTGVEVETADERLNSVIEKAEVVDSMVAETPDYGFADDGRSKPRRKKNADNPAE